MDDPAALDIRFHEETAPSYDEAVTREFAIYHRHWLYPLLDRLAAAQPGARVLDIGSGTGVVAIALAERGFDVVAVDHSPAMLEVAEANAHEAGVAVRFERGDATRLPFPDGSFAGITCQGVLHHLPDVERCLAEARRLLVPDGFLYISEPCVERTLVRRAFDLATRSLLAARRALLRRKRRDAASPTEAPISATWLLERLRELGFTVSSVEYVTHLPFVHHYLPDRPRLFIARALSFRRRRGDLVLVLARLQGAPPGPRAVAR